MLTINIVDIFHRWRVLDYVEFCQDRFKNWKLSEPTYDVMLTARSVDQLCIYVQY